MMPPGFCPERSRSSDGGSHGLPSLRYPYREVLRKDNMVPAMHSEYYSKQGPMESGNGRPQTMMAGGVMGMPPPQAYPPGFRPPSLHAEPPLSNTGPPGFRPLPVYNEALPSQSLPPGFRPPIPFRESLAIIQPEMKFHNADPNTHRPEFRLDDRPGGSIGRHDTMRGSSIYGATERHGWYPNESSSGAGRVNENCFVDPQIPKPYMLPSQPQSEHLPNQSRVVKLGNENWRQETLPQHVRPRSLSVPMSISPQPASYPEAGWAGNLRDGNLASTCETGKRCNYEDADNTSPTPSFKRQRIGDEVDSFRWGKSRRDLEFERTRLDGLRMNNGYGCEDSHVSSLHTRKQTESSSMTELRDHTREHWRDRQEWRTRHDSPHNLSHRGPYSPRDRSQAHINFETSQESKLRTKPSSFRPISHSDRTSLRTPPRLDRSIGKQKQHRNDRYLDTRNKHVNHGFWPRRLSLRSRFPDGRSSFNSRSAKVVDRNFRKGSRSPRLLAGKSSSTVGIDECAAPWRDSNVQGRIERKAIQNGSRTSLHPSQAVREFAIDERGQSGSQFMGFGVKHQFDTKGNVLQKETDPLDCATPALTTKIKVERASPPPIRADTNQKLPEMEMKTEQRGNLGKKLPFHKNKFQDLHGKASSSTAKHVANTGKNQSATIQPVSAKSLDATQNLTNLKSTCVSTHHVPQALDVDWKFSPEKITRRRRRRVGDEGPALLPKEQEANITGVSSPKLGQNHDDLQEGMLHTGKSSKSLLGKRSILDKRSVASERNGQASEARTVDGGLIKPCDDLSRVSTEVTLHPPDVVHGSYSQLAIGSEIGTGVHERTVQKVIFTGHRSEDIPSYKLQKTANRSGSQSPKSLGKSQTPGAGLLQDVPGHSCSQQVKEVFPSLTVETSDRGTEGSLNNLKTPMGDGSLPFFSLKRDQELFTGGIIKSDTASSKASAIALGAQKLSSLSKNSLLEESPVECQHLQKDQLTSCGLEGQLISSRGFCVEDLRVNPFVGESASFLDEFVEREVLLSGTNLNALILLAIETSKGLQPMDKRKSDLVQGEYDMKVLPRPFDSLDTSATGDKLIRQPDREIKELTGIVTKSASVLTDSRAAVVSEGREVMSTMPLLSDLNTAENHQAEKSGKFTKGSTESARMLVRVSTAEGETIPTEGEEGPEVTKQPSREVVETILHFDRELGKRQKLMHPEKGSSLTQVTNAEDATVNDKKTIVLESSGGTEKNNLDSILETSQMLGFKGGVQHTVPVLKTVDTFPSSSHLLGHTTVVPQVIPQLLAIPQLGAIGHSYRSNKTWVREVKPVSTQRVSNILRQRPVVVAQPSAYVRKKFSIRRFPAPPVSAQLNVSAQPNALSKLPQEGPNESGKMNSDFSTSKLLSHHDVNTIIAKPAVSASISMKTLNTKMSDVGAIPSENPRSSTVRRLNTVEVKSLVTQSELTATDIATKLSPSKPSHFEASSGLTTLACSMSSKSPDRGADDTVEYVVDGTRLYMQKKSNQVLVGPSPISTLPILRPSLEKYDIPMGYIKRKTNQLVRCSHHREVNANGASQNVVGEVGPQVKFSNRQRRGSAQLKTKTKLGRVLSQKNGRTLGLARVWTLSSEGRHNTSTVEVSRHRRYPLFPWKRVDMVTPRLRRGRPLHDGKMGALFNHISNQLQRYRSGHPLYTRSTDGFSLHRSGVMSRSGANLKWTKSLKNQSILASEAATKAVAEAEKRKRDKKEAVVVAVGKARDDRRGVQESGKPAQLRSETVDASSVSSLEPVGIGRVIYVRKGFGNQLVRDSRTIARAFANEKVRWSLHNARLRRAKKQGLCVYYTRFGVCKRGDGKCLYVHDPEKLAVCTKFLRGSCSDPACRLTHKVIPERMPDCSYFLEGLCTNENCSYRHVNVNPKAPVCEGFLHGYCADGDMCNKKHTYVCPEYTLTGKCTSSSCKLRHVQKAKQPTSASKESVGSKREGRYFAPSAEGQSVCGANVVGQKMAETGDDRADFISVDEIDLESCKKSQDAEMFLDERGVMLLSRLPKGGPSNVLEGLLKPRFLLKREVTS